MNLFPVTDLRDNWRVVHDGDSVARELYHRHYSRYVYKDGRDPKKIVGPGEYIMLLTWDDKALFVWRKFRSMDNQEGVNCAIFRNEGKKLSSGLILEAERYAWEKWPGESRLYTYVNPKKIRSKNPGGCFKKAGWMMCGLTKGGLHILEKRRLTCG